MAKSILKSSAGPCLQCLLVTDDDLCHIEAPCFLHQMINGHLWAQLIDFLRSELQNDYNDARLPFKLIWCVSICVINGSKWSCSMNLLRIKGIDDLSERARSFSL